MKIIISLTLVYLLFFPAKFLPQPQEIIDAYNLQNAIRSNNIDEINLLLADGIDVNIQYNGRNALHVACEGGSAEIVRLILSRGADVNARRDNGDGLTTLQNAIQGFNCSPEIINILLEKYESIHQYHYHHPNLWQYSDRFHPFWIHSYLKYNPMRTNRFLVDLIGFAH